MSCGDVEAEDRAGPRRVADQALGPAGEVPGLLALSAGARGVLDGEGAVDAVGPGEDGVGLLVVPDVGVGPPGVAVVVQDLRLQPAPAGRVAALHLQRHRLGEDRVVGKDPRPLDDADLQVRLLVDAELAACPAGRRSARPWRGRPTARR